MIDDKVTLPDNLAELEPYLLGQKFSGPDRKVARLNEHKLKEFLTTLEGDPIAEQCFETFDFYGDFYAAMEDHKVLFPKELWEELFYGAKLGGEVYRAIPSFCVYMIKKAWEAVDGIPNLIPKVLPKVCLKMFLSQNYCLGGITFVEVVKNVCCPEYNPLSLHRLKNKVGDFTEIYVPSTDMVAALPNDIANMLTDDGIMKIEKSPNGLMTGKTLLRTMCNRYGAVNSTYDLRNVF